TVRYTQLRAFEMVAAKFSKNDTLRSSVEVFAALVDEMVDLSADLLEGIAADLDAVSRSIFVKTRTRQRHQTRSNTALHRTLMEVGNAGDGLSRFRGILWGLQRVAPFASEPGGDWIQNDARPLRGVPRGVWAWLTD